MKKSIKLAAAAVLSLGLCWVGGQVLKGNRTDGQGQSDEAGVSSPVQQDSGTLYLEFTGATETQDNPWNSTAGFFEMDEGSCMLLTPNTSVLISPEKGTGRICLEYELHPWVRDGSDGAGLLIWLMDKNGTVLSEETVDVASTDEWKQAVLDLTQFPEACQAKILCNNGDKGDDSADWVIIRFADESAKQQVSLEDRTAGAEEYVVTHPKESNSLPKYAEFEITNRYEYPVISQGSGWDSVDVLNPSVIMWNGKFYNYYSGWNGNTWSTGLAISDDGINWEKSALNPVLDVTENGWDRTYIAANGCAIALDDSVYYYYAGIDEETGGTAIGLAVSADGVEFTKRTDKPVLLFGDAEDWDSISVSDPYVVVHDGLLYMYYCGQDSLGVQRLGLAISDDGEKWDKYKYPIMDIGANGAFDENGLGEPSVIYQYPYWYMLYTGRNSAEQRNIGVAVSIDGVNWRKLSYEGIMEQSAGSWDSQVICDTTLLAMPDGSIGVWYGGGDVPSPDQNLNGQIGFFNICFEDGFDLTHFDANEAWELLPLSNMDFVKGSYAPEGEQPDRYVWVSEEAAVWLENETDKEEVIINGSIPEEVIQRTEGRSFVLTFWLNGEPIEEKVFKGSGVMEVVLSKPDAIREDKYIELRVQASSYYNPKEAGVSEDARNLSWRLQRIGQQ